MIIPKLALRSLAREKTGAFSAVFGIAAAAALLAWNLEIAETAASQASRLAAEASVPFEGWLAGPAMGGGRGRAPGAEAANAAESSAPLKAESDATAGFRRGFSMSGALPDAVVEKLRGATNIVTTVFAAVNIVQLDVRPGGRVLQGPPLMASVTAIPADGKPLLNSHVIAKGAFPAPDAGAGVFDAAFNEKLFLDRHVPVPEIGSTISAVLRGGAVTLRVAGIFRADTMVRQFPTAYTTSAAQAEIIRLSAPAAPPFAPPLAASPAAPAPSPASEPSAAPVPSPQSPVPTLALLAPVRGAALADVEALLGAVPEARRCQYSNRRAVEARFRSDTVSNMMRQLPMSLSLAFITAVFMIATALSANISAQRRRIAILRCAGMTGGGVAKLVLVETAVIAAAGWLVGIVAATAFAQIFLLVENSPELPRLVVIGWKAPAVTAATTAAAAALSAIAPVIHACRVRPLEAFDTSPPRTRRVSAPRTLAGLLLLLPIVALALPFQIEPKLRSMLMIALGLPCFAAGAALCVHPLARLVELLAMRPAGALLRLDPRLLSRRLSRAPGRAAGAIITLSLCLGAFVAVHVWGSSLMSSYVPSPEWPDAIVSILPNGLDSAELAAATAAEGVAPGALPIEATQFALSPDTLAGIAARGLATPKSDTMLLFGADPAKAFSGASPLAKFRFVEGSPDEAAAALEAGGSCVIPLMFSRLSGLRKGDSLELGGRAFKIAAVVDLNWHLVTSRANLRTRFGPLDTPAGGGRGGRGAGGGAPADATPIVGADATASAPNATAPAGRQAGGPTLSMIFVSHAVAQEITRNRDTAYFLWLNLSPEYAKLHPLQATVRLDASLNAAIEAARAATGKPAFSETNVLRVHHRDEIADGTLSHGNDILGTMARIPFWSLLVASTGIAALLAASARATKRETDAMRAAGMTRGQLARLFAGEALFVILCALISGLAGGALVGWSFTAVTREQMGGGIASRIVVPWLMLLRGATFMTLLSIAMAALPISRATKTER